MRERLYSLIDHPVVIRTLPDDPSWKPTHGTVFAVHDDAVDVLIGTCVMKTIRLAAIIDVVIDEREARDMLLEAPPSDPTYPYARRRLFQAEEAQYLSQPGERVRALAGEAAQALREVRRAAPRHLGLEQLLERAHFLHTGRWDYELEPEVTGGEVPNHNYRFARARAEKLEEALRLRRPEDEVAGHVAALGKWAARALAKYPKHAELAGWLARAETLRGKLSEAVRKPHQLDRPFA